LLDRAEALRSCLLLEIERQFPLSIKCRGEHSITELENKLDEIIEARFRNIIEEIKEGGK